MCFGSTLGLMNCKFTLLLLIVSFRERSWSIYSCGSTLNLHWNVLTKWDDDDNHNESPFKVHGVNNVSVWPKQCRRGGLLFGLANAGELLQLISQTFIFDGNSVTLWDLSIQHFGCFFGWLGELLIKSVHLWNEECECRLKVLIYLIVLLCVTQEVIITARLWENGELNSSITIVMEVVACNNIEEGYTIELM